MPYISLSKQGNQTLQKGQYEMEALVMFQNGAKTGEMLTATIEDGKIFRYAELGFFSFLLR